jgi:uncharacterized membrane protein YgdD (TMEM256/DUF423 family)
MPSSALMDQRRRQWVAAVGALYAAAAVALSAYAAHAVLGMAQILAFGHGIALAALAPTTASRLGHIALLALSIGVLLFSGSLACSVFAQWPTTLAPLGGMLLIGGWLVFAIDLLRR